MKKKRGPSAYTDEFRREAVRLVIAGGQPVGAVARDLGVNHETLRDWIRRQTQQSEEPGRILLEEQNRQLRQENARLREEREILKKAAAFFAKDAQ